MRDISDPTTGFVNMFAHAESELTSPIPSTSISSMPNLDGLFNGLRPNEFTILCGSTGAGKTTLCANISASLLKDRVPQYVASVEVGPVDYIRRVMSALAGKNYNESRVYSEEEIYEFMKEHQHRFVGPGNRMSLRDNRMNVDELLHEVTVSHEQHGVKVAIIDNINFFLDVTTHQNAIVEMDRVIHELIMFCKRSPVHMIMIMHPKKTDDRRVENEFDIKGSSTAVQEAHNVILFNRPHPEICKDTFVDLNNDREIKFVKMRRGGSPYGKRLILGCENTVKYFEKAMVETRAEGGIKCTSLT